MIKLCTGCITCQTIQGQVGTQMQIEFLHNLYTQLLYTAKYFEILMGTEDMVHKEGIGLRKWSVLKKEMSENAMSKTYLWPILCTCQQRMSC